MATLSNKLVFITGASSGIGVACADTFAEAGARLLLCARREDRLYAVADRLHEQHGTRSHPFVLDVTDAAAVTEAIATLPADWRDIDVLVNNAGLAKGFSPVYENQVDEIDVMVDTNVKGLLYVTKAVVRGMVERGSGHIINIGSTAGHGVYGGGTVYCATKHAVGAITQGLKIDLHGTRVRVSTVDPGIVETDFSLVRFSGDQERADSVYSTTEPLTPEDVAQAVYWCASRPAHVNISEIILMPVLQSSSSMIKRH